MMLLHGSAAQGKSQHISATHFRVYQESFAASIDGFQEGRIGSFAHTLHK